MIANASVARGEFINAMRNVASSVTVVTTDGEAGRFGATVSAFSSLSADPPSVLVCMKSDSRIAWAVQSNGAYCVNVLPESAADLADRFAGRFDHQCSDRFNGVTLMNSVQTLPVIENASAFLCKVGSAIEHGSHKIFVGQVQQVIASHSPPLTYLDGAYHSVQPQHDFLQEQHA